MARLFPQGLPRKNKAIVNSGKGVSCDWWGGSVLPVSCLLTDCLTRLIASYDQGVIG